METYMVPGQLARPATRSMSSDLVTTYVDNTLDVQSDVELSKRDYPLLVVASLSMNKGNLRPILVLTPRGELTWVVDVRLNKIDDEGGW